MPNHYEFLNIESTASSEEIQKAIELAHEHYDLQKNSSNFNTAIEQLEEAEEILLDSIRRAEYNRNLQRKQKKKKYQEQIAKEQEELQSFQSQTFANSDLLEVSSQTQTSSISNHNRTENYQVSSNSQEQDPYKNQREQETVIVNESNQISITSSSQTQSSYSSPSGLKDWQKSVLTGSVMGIFVLLGFSLIKPNTFLQRSLQIPIERSTKAATQNSSLDTPNISQINKSNGLSQTSSSLVRDNTQVQKSEQDSSEPKIITSNFPLDSCGDKDPGEANTWYPVYVKATGENLSTIHRHYCRDAFRKYRKEIGIESIQVASFIDRSKAEAFAESIKQDIESSEVGKPYIYGLNNSSANYYSENSSSNDNDREIDENESIALIERLYDLLSQKRIDEARSLYVPQFSYQFNPDFFSKFEKVSVNNLRITSRTSNSINFIGKNTYIWFDGSSQKELRSYTVSNLNDELKITASKFIKVTKSRS
jgi:hypothetical protein